MSEGMGTDAQGYRWIMDPLPIEEMLPDVLRAWAQHGLAAGHSDRTISSRAYTVRRLASSGVDPMSATRDDLEHWLATRTDPRSGETAKRSTKATYRAQLRAFYHWLVTSGRREDDPAVDLPSLRVRQGIPRPTTTDQVRSVIAACSDPRAAQTRAYVILAAFAGLRVHEVAKVRGEDVQGDVLLVTGKGGSSSSVPLHPMVADLAARMPRSGWWFPSDTAVGHVSRVSVSLAIKRAMDRAGVVGTPHALRHHYGTQVLRASGGDLRVTQRALRHASVATTAIYTQVADDTLRRAVSGIPA